MVDEHLSRLSPTARLATVVDQTNNLSNRMWSVALRSDIAPRINSEEVD